MKKLPFRQFFAYVSRNFKIVQFSSFRLKKHIKIQVLCNIHYDRVNIPDFIAVFVRFIVLREVLVCKLHANTSFQEKQPLFF